MQDAIRQVHEVVAKAKEELEETQDTEACVFRPVMLSALVKVLDHAQAQFPRDVAHLISGWKHSLYPCCRFDTAQEFQVAKILDGTADITWIRNPAQQVVPRRPAAERWRPASRELLREALSETESDEIIQEERGQSDC